MQDLITYKNLAEEANLSFQRFQLILIGFVNQNACLTISQFNDKPYIYLQTGKQEYYLMNESSCTVYMHTKKNNRFFISFNEKAREFESKEAERVVFYLNLAMQKYFEG